MFYRSKGGVSRVDKTKMAGWRAAPIVMLVCMLFGSGCDHKAKECDQLIRVMNQQGDAIRSATKKMGESNEDITAIRSVAGEMEKAATTVHGVKLKDKKLQGFAGDYEKLMRSGSEAARKMADAAKQGKQQETQQASGEIRESQKTEAELVKKINAYCAP